ncbi:kynurenine formamidase-like, partial [Chrysoperla carnea]|uniref:kynurenine formamidase-like n=1 Tax=Chrysoperla carnea TaxID=189513 RepID=UPI001D08F019
MDMINNLDDLYTPSKWCKRFNSEGTLKFFTQRVTKGSEVVRHTIPCKLNVAYGPEIHQKLDIFGNDLPKDSPIFIFIHGGYWQTFSKNESCFMAKMLYMNKIKTIVIGYYKCPYVTLNQQLNDVTKGVKKSLELAEKWNTSKVIIAGHSAGAFNTAYLLKNLSQFTQKQKNLIQGLVLIGGLYDITPLIDTYINKVIQLTLKEAEELTPCLINLNEKLKMYLIIPEYESPAFVAQNQMYYDRLKNAGYDVQMIQFKNCDHYTIMENLMKEEFELSQFI